jgi:hypothetical protein
MRREEAGLVFAVLVFFAAAGLAFGIEERKDESEEAEAYNVTRTIKTVAGLNFVVEEDRPIEKVGSIYRPIDMDSYVALKFNRLQAEMMDLLAVQEQKIAELTERVRVLEERQPVQAPETADASAPTRSNPR